MVELWLGLGEGWFELKSDCLGMELRENKGPGTALVLLKIASQLNILTLDDRTRECFSEYRFHVAEAMTAKLALRLSR